MTHDWDEFSKSLAEPLPRRESLRRIGLVVAGTVLSPLGMSTILAGHDRHSRSDPCKAFCKCRNKKQQNQCLNACNTCGKNPSRLGGSCGNYFCCGAGLTPCGSYCADLAGDPDNCGACGHVCAEPGPYEYGTCLFGECEYACAEGAVYCDGYCMFLGWDPDNCGECGSVCPGSAPYCNDGVCFCPSEMSVCDGECVDTGSNPDNCGGCGNLCPSSAPYCIAGVCSGQQCAPGLTWCFYGCTDLNYDPRNCGACGHQCGSGDGCSGGHCSGTCYGCY